MWCVIVMQSAATAINMSISARDYHWNWFHFETSYGTKMHTNTDNHDYYRNATASLYAIAMWIVLFVSNDHSLAPCGMICVANRWNKFIHSTIVSVVERAGIDGPPVYNWDLDRQKYIIYFHCTYLTEWWQFKLINRRKSYGVHCTHTSINFLLYLDVTHSKNKKKTKTFKKYFLNCVAV